jgi:polyphosphate kinase
MILKFNSLVDPEMVQKIYEASQAGVDVKLIIRGVCCLVPQLQELSETVEVISIVGTYLEHSRICYFENDGEHEVYITSADLMERNLDRRVELLIPVTQPSIRKRLIDILKIYLKDNVKARVMQSDGSYVFKEVDKERVNAQVALAEMAKANFHSQLEIHKKNFFID